jgi:rifampin ADP-ribosylating transferase
VAGNAATSREREVRESELRERDPARAPGHTLEQTATRHRVPRQDRRVPGGVLVHRRWVSRHFATHGRNLSVMAGMLAYARPTSDERTAVGKINSTHVPVTYESCEQISGPFYHGTKSALEVGDELVPGFVSNFHVGRVSNNIYFTALVGTAAWGAELATAVSGMAERGHIYIVEPLGPFEDDPNVTNKKFPGNVTQSYRSRHPLRVIGELNEWEGHDAEVLQGMLDNLKRMREQGLDVIED